MEFKFNVGDRVRCIGKEREAVITRLNSDYDEPVICIRYDSGETDAVYERLWELVNSIFMTTVEKKIYSVLVVDKKTGLVEKEETVVAENEQSAILKAFGVDAENVFIKTTEQGKYEDVKPINAILIKEEKK